MIKSFLTGLSACVFLAIGLTAQIAQVQHAPSVNGTIEGSVQQMLPEGVTLNGGASITGDLLVPGTPLVQLNGTPVYGGTLEGSGSTFPSNYNVMLNGGAKLRHVIRRTNSVPLPTVAAVPTSSRTASVTITAAGQSIAWSTLKNLTLNSNVGQVTVPAGTYGNFIANGGTGFTLGVAGAVTPTVYNFQNLTLNGNCQLNVLGPVIVNVANGFTGNGAMGASGNPAWLTLNIKSGGFTLNGGCILYGYVLAPSGTVIINGNSQLIGGVISDRLTVNGNGLLKLQSAQTANQSPIVSLTAPTNGASYTAPASFTLSANASDPDGTVAKVEFFQGTTKIGQSLAAPFNYAVSGLAAGNYTYFARVTDNAGATADSVSITVIVSSPNQPPVITLTAPVDGATFTAPATLMLKATAVDPDGTISRVDFYQGSMLIGQSTTAPFQVTTSTLFAGTYVFSAKAVDNAGAIASSTITTITVVNPNQPPAVSITSPVDGSNYDDPAGFTVAATATDADGTVFKVEFFRNGILVGEDPSAPFSFTVTGLAIGTYDYVARATDNQGLSTDSTPVRIHVVHLNDAPVANAQSLTTAEETPITITLSGTDPDGDALIYTTVSQPTHGTLSPGSSSATLIYTPAQDFNGNDSFTFKVSDGALQSAPASVQVAVTPVNDAPVTYPASVVLNENTSASFVLAATDVDSTSLTFSVLSGPSHGALSGALPNVTYTPAANYSGSDSFVYRAFDGQAFSMPSMISISVVHVNRLPSVTLTAPSSGSTFTAPANFMLQATAADTDGSVVKVEFFQGTDKIGEVTSAPFQLTVTSLPVGAYSYTARATDNSGASTDSTTISLTVATNNPPVASLTAPVDGATFTAPATITLGATASDSDGTITRVEFYQGTTLLGQSTNSPYGFITPALPAGTYVFSAKAFDNLGATVTTPASNVTVANPNQPPVVSITSPINGSSVAGPAAFTITAEASDPDGSVSKVEFFHGSTKIGEAVAAPYQILWNDIPSGSYVLTARATDNADAVSISSPVTLSVNMPPVANAQNVATSEGTSVNIVLTGSDLETPSTTLAFIVLTQPSHGLLTGTAPNLNYVPNANYSGSDSFTFKVNDGSLDSASATVGISINAVNHAPVVSGPASVATPEDTSVNIALTATDPEGDPLIYSVIDLPQHGILSGSAPNLSYTPGLNFNGIDGFTFKVSDGSLDSLPATVAINVTPVNDAPVADSATFTVVTGMAKPLVLTGSDIETAAESLVFTVVSNPTHGILSGVAPNLTYTSAPDFGGFDSFTFTVNDGTATSAPATVQLTSGLPPRSRTYTTTQDFAAGTLTALSTAKPDELSNRIILSSYDAVWIANSSKGTVIKIDPETGRVVGEFNSKPVDAAAPYPSRVAIDSKGNIWVANLSHNSVVKIGLPENGHWVDRNGNGLVDTSGTLGDIRDWNGSGVDDAQDEAILLYIRTEINGVRHLTVDKEDNVWVGGTSGPWQKFDGLTGELLRTEPSIGLGGQGGFIADDGKLYSAGTDFLVWQTANPIAELPLSAAVRQGAWSSALDSQGNLWVTKDWTSTVIKYSPTGTMLGEFYHGEPWAMGIAIDANDHVWVAHSHCGHSVGHLLSDGSFIGNVEVANHGPVEVSIDRRGRIWVVSSTGVVERINPLGGAFGADGTTPIGEVDLITGNLGGALWTYGRFTGSSSGLSSPEGLWTFVYDGVLSDSTWGPVVWNALLSNDGTVAVEAALSANGITYGTYQPLTFSNPTPVGSGRFLKVRTRLISAITGETPTLYDLSVGTEGYVPPAVPSSWSVFAGEDIAGNWPDVIQLKGAFRHTVHDFAVPPTYAWTVVSGPGAVTFDDATILRPKVQFGALGTYILRVTATLNSAVSTSEVKVSLTPYNRAPYANAGYTTFRADLPSELWLWGEVRDDGLPVGTPVTSTWTKLFGPGTVSFTDPGAPVTKASFSAPGVYVLQLTATDGTLTSSDVTTVWLGYSCIPVAPTGLVSWWQASGNGDDHVGGNQAFTERGTDYAEGKIGGAFRFDGVNDRVRIFSAPSLDAGAGDGFSVELWVNPDTSRTATIFEYATNTSRGFNIRQEGTQLAVDFRETDNTPHVLTVGGALPVATWTHLAATYDKTSGEARVYINGTLSISQTIGSFVLGTNLDVNFGGRPNSVESYDGLLDEISIYNRPIYADEITTMISHPAGKRPPVSNVAPIVSAGPTLFNKTANTPVTLNGVITDDGQPIDGVLTSRWTKLSGPGLVNFASATSPQTTATFSEGGVYLLELEADDGGFCARSTVEVRVDALYQVEPDATLGAWWPFNVDDLDVIHGLKMERLNGAVLTNDGKISRGLQFDGVNDYTRTNASPHLDIGASAEGLTIEFWAKPTRVQDNQNLVTWGTSTQEGVKLVGISNHTGFYVYLKDADGGDHTVAITGGYFVANVWQHVAVTYDKVTGVARIYRDGILWTEQTLGVFTPRTNLPLVFGADRLGTGGFYQGALDEVTFYTRPLTITEIAAVYSAGAVGKALPDNNTPPVVNAGPDISVSGITLAASLVAQVTDDGRPLEGTLSVAWSKVEGPGTVIFGSPYAASTMVSFSMPGVYVLRLDANDGLNQSVGDLVIAHVGTSTTEPLPIPPLAAWWPGNGHPREVVKGNHDVELYNGAGYGVGQVSQGFSFDGSNDHGRVAAHSDLDIGASAEGLTIEFWAKPARVQDNQNLVTWGTSTQEGVKLVGISNHTGFYVYLKDTDGGDHTVAITGGYFVANVWQHVAVTYDKVTGVARIYRDGILWTEQTLGVFTPRTNLPLVFGADRLGTGGFYQGLLDEVTFYTRPLTITEIAAIHNAGTNGKTPLDNNQPPVVSAGPDVEIPGISNTATLSGTVTDDNKPFGAPEIQWTLVEGPAGGVVTFADSASAATTATFSVTGTYLLKLTATEGYVAPVSDLMEVRVGTATVEPSASIAAWWPGNGHPREVVKGNHDVELYNGAGYGAGQVSQGFTFDGTDDHGRVAAHSDLDIGASAEGLTIEFWAKPTRVQDNQNLVTWGTSTQEGVKLVGISNHTGFYVYLKDADGGDHTVAITGGYFVANVWQHVAVTYDKVTGVARIYRDGILWTEQTLGVFTPRTNLPLVFGADRLGTGGFYQGLLDEVTFYTRPLTITEIAAIYTAGSNGKTPLDHNQPPVVSAGPDVVIPSVANTATLSGTVTDDNKPFGAPAIQWALVEGPGGGSVTFGDASNAATTATFSVAGTYLLKLTATEGYVAPVSDLMEVRVGTATVEPSASIAAWWPGNGHPREVVKGNHDVELYNGAGYGVGQVSQGFSFDGSNDHGRVAAHSDLDIGASAEGLTIEFWAKPTRVQDNQNLVTWGTSTQEGVKLVGISNHTGFYVYLKDADGGDHTVAITGGYFVANVWQHVAVTYDKVTGVARIYRDGTLWTEQTLGVFTPRTNLPLVFGANRLGTGGFYQGSLDEVTFYTRPLTITEISTIHSAGSNGKTPLDENTPATILLDTPISGSSAQNNTSLTLSALATDTDGTVAKVEFFDGTTKLGETIVADAGQPNRFSFTLPTGFPLGAHILTARATDNDGAVTTSSLVTLNVVPVLPLVALTSPVANATVPANGPLTLAADATYSAGALAKVEFFDGATKLGESFAPVSGFSYELLVAAGLSVGSHTLTAKAIAVDASVATSAPLHITANVVLPLITLTSPTNGSTVVASVPVTLKASATTAQGTIAKVEFFDGATKLGERIAPDSIGGSVYTFTQAAGFTAGTHSLSAKATTSTNSTATSAGVTINAGTYTGAPVVEISTPDDAARISAPTTFTGIVAVPSLTGWSLDYRLKEADGAPVEPWTSFAAGSNLVGSPASGSSAALPAALGTFDPTRLINGIYEVQLHASTASLNIYIAGPITVVVEGNMKVGAFTLAFEDLKVPVAGVPISITRTYDSRDSRVGDFGPGWCIAVNNVRVQKNRHLGSDWYQTPQAGSGIQFYYVEPITDRIVTVTMPDGESHRFRAGAFVRKRLGDPDNASFAVVNFDGRYKFYPLGDTTSTLEPVDSAGQLDDHFYIHGTGDQDLRTEDQSDPFSATYNPTRFRLTTKDGTQFIVDERLGLLELKDLTGNTLVLNRDTQDRVTSLVSTFAGVSGGSAENSGQTPGGQQAATVQTTVTIHRDANGRVDYIRDPSGHDLDYTYDGSGRLDTFTNRELDATQFKYENAAFPYYLTKIIDPRGVTALRSEFDTDGKLTKQIDADGKETVFERGINVTGRFEKVIDRLGHSSTFYYDERGNVTTKIDPLGAQTTFSYYPDSDWVKFETDHYGNTKSMAYDTRGNVTVQTIGASLSENPATPTTGYTTHTTYNALSAPTQITDPDGRTQTFDYDPATNNLLSNTVGVGGAAPATTTYHYNADGTLDTITDALGNVTKHTYNYAFTSASYPGAVKQITVTVTDPAGTAGSDSSNASATVLRTSRTISDVQENMIAQLATRTLPAGGTEEIITRYVYDAENRLAATIMPDGKVSETHYTSFGQTDKSLLWKSVADYQTGTESLARITSYGYDNRGNQTSTIYPDGSSESSHFDLEGRRDWSEDKLGRRTVFQYDDAGRLRFTIQPDATPADLSDNPYTETVYDLTGRVTDTYDELRHRSSVVYYPDGTPEAGRRKQSIQHLTLNSQPSTLTTSYSYDASGNVRFVTDPRGNTTETRYDEQGRPTTVVYPATDEHSATQTSTKYNVLGQRIETVDMEGKVSRFRSDGLGRLFEVRQYLDSATAISDSSFQISNTNSQVISTRYTFDELGHQLTQTDARGNATNYRYDSLGRRTQRILPDNATETLQYDGWGNLWKRTDFKGYTTTFLYDTLNRLTEKQADPSHPSLIYSHAPDKITYGYDAAGNRTDATVEKGSTVLYVEDTPIDERGRRQFKNTPYGKLTYGYYANSQLKGITSSNTDGVRLGYRYDEANRLAFVDDTSGLSTLSAQPSTTSYSYNANGSLETITAANGIKHAYSYDSLNRLRTLNVAKNATSLHSYEYKLRASGHRRQVIEGAKTTTYTYDDLYRLTSETVSGTGVSPVGSVTYTLDKVGNREARTSSIAPVASTTNTFNSRDWLSGDTYDANGNTRTSPLTAYGLPLVTPDTYDFEDHLIIRHKPDGSTVNLSYDADGLLRQKTVLNAASLLVSATGYLQDSMNPTGYAQIMEERINTTAGTTAKTYAYGSDLISQITTLNSQPSTLRYFTYDGLGSVRELTNESGAITDAYDYDAFGNLVYRSGTTDNAYLYRGERFESDIGQYYLRARFYNQNTGRFWNQDSYEGSASDPASLHKYFYANANPVSGWDPSGNFNLNDAILTVWNVGVTAGLWVARVAPAVATTAKVLATVAGYTLSALNVYWFATDAEFRGLIASTPGGTGLIAADTARLVELGHGLVRLGRSLASAANAFRLAGPRNLPKAGHEAEVTLLDRDGKLIAQWGEASGAQTPEQLAMGFPRGSMASHTEVKAIQRVQLSTGETLIIRGTLPPCPNCQGAMRARSASGLRIEYQYAVPSRENGEDLIIKVWENGEKL